MSSKTETIVIKLRNTQFNEEIQNSMTIWEDKKYETVVAQ